MQSVTTTACGRLETRCICTATCPAAVVLADVNTLREETGVERPRPRSHCSAGWLTLTRRCTCPFDTGNDCAKNQGLWTAAWDGSLAGSG